jgi:ATP/maltotriose-dependent transcriptional regulator MalT
LTDPPRVETGAGADRGVLLATKLRMPRLRDGFVARPRLTAWLTAAVSRELVLVCAPAGFGKSSAVAEWAAGCDKPVAWLSLDEVDNDPVRFWRHIAAAVDTAWPGIEAAVAARSGGPSTPSFHPAVAVLVNELAASTQPIVLVLDDYHVIESATVHASLAYLLERLPVALRLVVAGRADPPLPLARMRARGQLAELRAADLRFTVAESAALLGAAGAGALPQAAAAALAARTEGWAAGLQLAALSLSGCVDVEAFVAEFSGSNRFVLDYLTEEVLDGQQPDVRQFLLETSVLERLSGPLCDALRGRDDSQQLLERVERANLFLHPLDDRRQWWRYHHLFADLLRARLAREQPDRVAVLHRAAGDWYARYRLADQAVHHLLAVDDHERAADVVAEHAQARLARREAATLHRWFAALPDELVAARPDLCATKALSAVVSGHAEDAEPLLAAADGGGRGRRLGACRARPPYRGGRGGGPARPRRARRRRRRPGRRCPGGPRRRVPRLLPALRPRRGVPARRCRRRRRTAAAGAGRPRVGGARRPVLRRPHAVPNRLHADQPGPSRRRRPDLPHRARHVGPACRPRAPAGHGRRPHAPGAHLSPT